MQDLFIFLQKHITQALEHVDMCISIYFLEKIFFFDTFLFIFPQKHISDCDGVSEIQVYKDMQLEGSAVIDGLLLIVNVKMS